MATTKTGRAGDAAGYSVSTCEFSTRPETIRSPTTPQATESRPRRQRRPPASAAERELVRRIARFIVDHGLHKESWLVAMVSVAVKFPDVELESVLVAYVLRDLLAPRGVLQ